MKPLFRMHYKLSLSRGGDPFPKENRYSICGKLLCFLNPLESNASVFEAAGLLYQILNRNLNYRVSDWYVVDGLRYKSKK